MKSRLLSLLLTRPLPLAIVMLITLALAHALVGLFVTSIVSRNDDGMGRDSESIGSRFKRSQGRIYVNIPFQGYYLLPTADAESFQSISRTTGHPLAKDNQAVYCGSQRITGLSPGSLQLSANGYVSDGQNAWFCSNEKDNPDYRWWQELTHRKCADCADKPRLQDYFLTKLETHASSLKTIAFDYAYDDQRIYYQGLAIPDSDSQSVQLVVRGFGDLKGRESNDYLRDGKHVYFKGQTLEGASPAQFSEWIAERSNLSYGLDSSNGQFYIGSTRLPGEVDGVASSNLQPLLFDDSRGYHELFINTQGIWYWDYQGEQLKQACRNPFTPGHPLKELSPGVWADEQDTYVARSAEVWRNSKNGRGPLKWRMTHLIRLPGLSANDWKEVENLKRDIWSQGTLWQAKGTYYFLPASGNGHGFNDALYPVGDLPLLRRITTEPEFLGGKAMKALQSLDDLPGTSIACQARSYYPGMLGF